MAGMPAAPERRPTPSRLRRALRAYIATVPDPRRLDAHLAGTTAAASARAIRSALRAVIDTIERFFASLPAGAVFDAQREGELPELLRKAHAWLDEECCRSLLGFARWYAWHEGLLPRRPPRGQGKARRQRAT
jgi:hypothetical protein